MVCTIEDGKVRRIETYLSDVGRHGRVLSDPPAEPDIGV
jgi:hypothetical protein